MDIPVFSQLSLWQQAAVCTFGISLAVQLFYQLFFFLRLAVHKPKKPSEFNGPVSVIICAWNEEENLKKWLRSILEQDYAEFEVIVVNDHSTDDTEFMLRSWQMESDHLKVINLTSENSKMRGKKFAIAMGIKAAKHEHLVLTDADCRPKSDQWLKRMASGLKDGHEVVLGYGGFEKKKGLLNKLYRYEGLHTAVQYLSYALAGFPYMGVGRNLAYEKELFFATKGFVKHRHISSGDDDLLVNEVATRKNTVIEVGHDSHTVSLPQISFATWWRQKRRHLTTGGLYRPSTKILLGIFLASHFFFYLSFFWVLSIKTMYWYALCGICVKWLVHLSVIRTSLRTLDEDDLLLFSLVGDLISPFLNTAVAMANLIKPPVRWR